MALEHVVWLGGPPCSGKTSIARILAGRHDLRAYHSDAHTWEHHDKAVERRYPAAARTESLGPDELWLAELDALVAQPLEANEERCRLMLEDIEALPPSPLIVAEGTPLFPWLVEERLASRDHAVWLVPTPEFSARGSRSGSGPNGDALPTLPERSRTGSSASTPSGSASSAMRESEVCAC